MLAKLKSIGISGTLYNWFVSYLIDRYQRVIIDGANSDWRSTESRVVPQGSGPLLFRIYINDISDDISSDLFLFADDSLSLEELFSPTVSADKLNCDLMYSVSTLASKWLVTMNVKKTKAWFSQLRLINLFIPLFFCLTI